MNEKTVCGMVETLISESTGEIKSSVETRSYKKQAEPNFIKMYLDDIILLVSLPKGISNILNAILGYMGYNNVVVLNKGIKMRIAEELGLTLGTVNQSITPLVKKKILIREDRGVFLLNPYLFGKGKWEDIRKVRLSIDYTSQKRIIKSEIIKENEYSTSETDTNS